MNKKTATTERSTKERFIEKLEELYDKVFRRCYSKTSSKEVAKDLTQDIFTRTWDYINRGKEIKYLNSFIYQVTSNRIKDYYKKKKSIPMANMGDFDEKDLSSDSFHTYIIDRAEVKRVRARLYELGEKYAEVIRMRIFEGMSPKEIGEKLGERTNTVSVRIHRGLKKFRKLLNTEPMKSGANY
ncbi:MAG: sigma-70 family RNA polymerase sigma factor [Candidatus Paceibacterota bacterium]